MSRVDTPWSLPDRTIVLADEADREIRISDFALMALLPLRSIEVSGYPLNELAMGALVGFALWRPARGGARLSPVVIVLVGALLGLLLYSGLANQVDWTKRMGHVAIMVGLVWAFGTGRISLRSSALGLATSLLAVIGLALTVHDSASYEGRLTGFLADPNAGAFYIAVLGTLAIFFSDDRVQVRAVVAVPVVAGLALTYSRTGLLAGAFVIIWVLLGRRLRPVSGSALAATLIWAISSFPKNLKTFGPFSDRSGSDALRGRIVAQMNVQLSDAPWYGHGPGTARVSILDQEFFFHNSYLAARQEGGWLALLLVVALLCTAFVMLSSRARRGDLSAAGAQAALIGTAVMGLTLGEVLLDTPMAVAVGFALGQALKPEPEPQPVEAPDG